MIEQEYLLNRLIKQACYHKQAYNKKVAMLRKLSSGNMEKTALDLSALQPILSEAGNFAWEAFNPVNALTMLGYAAAPVGTKDFIGNRNALLGYRMFAETASPQAIWGHLGASIAAPLVAKKILPAQKVPANFKRPESMLEVWMKGAIPYYKAVYNHYKNKLGLGGNKSVSKVIQQAAKPEIVQNIAKQVPQINNAVNNVAQKAVQKINPYKMLGAAGAGLAVPLAVGGLYKYLQNRNKQPMEKQAILGGPGSNNPLRAAIRRAAELKRQVGRRVWNTLGGSNFDSPGVPLAEQAKRFGPENATRKNLKARLQTAGEASIGIGNLSKNPKHHNYVPPEYALSDGTTIGKGDFRYFKKNMERGGIIFNSAFGHYEEPGSLGKLFGKKTKWVQDFNPGQDEIDNYFNVRNMLKEYKTNRAGFNKKVYGTETPGVKPQAQPQTQPQAQPQAQEIPWGYQAAAIPAIGAAGYGAYRMLRPSHDLEDQRRDKKIEAIRNIAQL